jgi:hypothetical protein
MVNFLNPEPIDAFTEAEEQPEPVEYKLPVKHDPFDAAPLLDLFKRFHGEIDLMANKSMGLMVIDDNSLSVATTYTTQAKALAQAIEKKRVELKAPYLEVVKVLDGETKHLKDRTAEIQQHLNGKIQPYLTKKENERREAERKAQEERDRIQKELDDKAEAERQAAAEAARKAALAEGMTKREAAILAQQAAAMVEAAPVVVAQEMPAETKVSTESGTAKLKEEWSFEITDIKALPDAAFESRKAEVIKALSPWVNNQVKAGARNISGVKIFKVAKVATRTSKGAFQF